MSGTQNKGNQEQCSLNKTLKLQSKFPTVMDMVVEETFFCES